MKKIISILLVLLMPFIFVGCKVNNNDKATLSIVYVRDCANKYEIPNPEVGGNYEYKFEKGHCISEVEEQNIIKDVESFIPENNGGYYTYTYFFESLDNNGKSISIKNLKIDKDTTLYYTCTGGNAPMPEPTGTYSLDIKDENNLIFDKRIKSESYYPPQEEIKFHSKVYENKQIGLFLNDGTLHCTGILTDLNGEKVWEYIFIMPANSETITFKFIDDDKKSVKDFIFSENDENIVPNLDDIKKIRYEQGYCGIKPGDFNDIYYTENREEIAQFYNSLSYSVEIIYGFQGDVSGGWYNKITFITDKGKFTLSVNNGNVYSEDRYYKINGNIGINFEEKDNIVHNFVTYNDNYDVIYKDGRSITLTGISKFEFKEYKGDIPQDKNEIKILFMGAEIDIINAKIFKFNSPDNNFQSVVYEITGEQDFSKILNN